MTTRAEITTITQCFEERVRENPTRTATRVADREMTYGELDALANGVAHDLVRRHVAKGDRIGLRIERMDLLAPAIFGILKAGCVFVPLDPTYPEARTRFVLDDCRASLVLDDAGVGAVEHATAPPNVDVDPDDLAYVLYTSGSTGTPKGVMQSHASLGAFVRNYTARLGIVASDRLSMLFSYSFAAANMDIFGALLTGATLCYRPVRSEGVAGLSEWISAERISILHAVLSVFRQLLASLRDDEILDTVRAVDIGGEPLLSTDVDHFRAHFPESAVLVHHYAATELSVIAQMPITAGTRIEPGAVPAGFPPPGVEIRILDERGDEAAAGEVGEISVRSRHMSPGYWNLPELTARAFSSDPESDGVRVYLTGDLGRIDALGRLENLGRKDSRVKIRGQSVEVAEVENALLATGDFTEAVVASRLSPLGSSRLVAWVVPRPGATPTVEVVRARLAETLPDYMVPSSLVLLDQLLRMPSGKVDRAALPDPESVRPVLEAALVAPRDDLETTMCRMWETITGVKPVGVDDDFFALGGDSLGAAELFVQLERLTGRRMPLSTILRAPTVARLTQFVRADPGYTCAWHLTTLREGGTGEPLFFVHGLRGGVVFLRELVEALEPNRPCLAFEADGRFDGEFGASSLEDLAAAYIALLRAAQPRGPYHICGYSAGGLIAFEIARQLAAAGERIALLGVIDTYAPVKGRRVSRLQKRLNHFRVLASLPPAEAFAFARRTLARIVRRERKRIGGPDVDGPLRRAMLELVKAYVPEGGYPGHVDLFRPAIPSLDIRFDPTLGWNQYDVGDLTVHNLPGDHRTILEGDNARALARAIDRALGRACPP